MNIAFENKENNERNKKKKMQDWNKKKGLEGGRMEKHATLEKELQG